MKCTKRKNGNPKKADSFRPAPISRVFVSSTFNDLQDERNALNREVLPYIRNAAAKAGVDVVLIDLRWGITAEESESGLVPSLCLSEIDACRPLFMGIVGGRYGWIPENWRDEDIRGYPFIKKRKQSLTELEMEYGAFSSYATGSRAFFLIKKNVEIARDDVRKLRKLKKRIRKSGYPFAEYCSIDEFVKHSKHLMLEMLGGEACLGNTFDPTQKYDSMLIEQNINKLTGVFRGREDSIKALESFVDSKGGYIVVNGAHGVGKSALIAEYCRRHSWDSSIVGYFSEVTDKHWQSAAIYFINTLRCRRVVSQLDNDNTLRRVLVSTIREISAQHPITLVIDAADKFDYLGWLPDTLPNNVHIILTLSNSETMQKLYSLSPQVYDLRPLNIDEISDITNSVLAKYGKKLDRKQLDIICHRPCCSNARFLSTTLYELRLCGIYEEITALLEKYVSCQDVPQLMNLVVLRIFDEYPAASAVLPVLVCAPVPISESELPELCSITQNEWLSLRNAIIPYLSTVGVMIEDSDFRAAAYRRCFDTSDNSKEVLNTLVRYYSCASTSRKANILTKLLVSNGEYDALMRLLSDIPVLAECCRRSMPWLRDMVGKAQSTVGMRLAELILDDLTDFETEDIALAASFFTDLEEWETASLLLDKVIERSNETACLTGEQLACGCLARIKQRSGDLAEAERLLERKVSLCDELGMDIERARALGNLGVVYYSAGRIDDAEKNFTAAKQSYSELGYSDGALTAEGYLGSIALSRGDIGSARSHFNEQERLSVLCDNSYSLSSAKGGLGLVCLAEGQPNKAEPLFCEQLKINRAISDPDGIQTAIGNIAIVHMQREEWVEAKAQLLEKLKICEATGNTAGCSNALSNLAHCEQSCGNAEAAEHYAAKRVELLSGITTLIEQLPDALCRHADMLIALGKKHEALDCAVHAKAVAMQLGQNHTAAEAGRLINQISDR